MNPVPESTHPSPPAPYEPPRIELELTDEQLTREVQYAAFGSTVE